RAEAEGHGAVPSYRPPTEAGAGPGYDLVAGASDHHINSVFAGTEVVRSRTAAPPVRLHPDDAARDGITDGSTVWVGNDRGGFRAVAELDADLRPGVLATTKGWWRMGVNTTVDERDSDMGRGAVFHDTRVRIEPAFD
ncbi:MAG: molybdopterin dinucleotide binding domain-containing protein, partial [Actinomycetota bacterium]